VTLSPEVIAALWGAVAGALAGGVSTVAIGWGTSLLHRKRRAKAIKVALYYEIFGHNLIEVDPAPEGDPNFVILGFARASYDAYLDEIPDLLPEKLVGQISRYYARVTTGASQQQQIDEDTAKAREAAQKLVNLESRRTITHPVHPDEVELLKQEGRQIADRMSKMMVQNRMLLAVAMGQQEQLLKTLHKEFSHDPATEPLEVLPKYREWLTKMTQGALNKGKPMSNGVEQSDPKDVAFYSAVVSGWIETKMERDRTIVTLSAGAIGLLVTVLATVGVKTPFTVWLYAGALVGFGVAGICTIVIFHRNATYLEKVVQGTTSKSTMLGWLDRVTLIFFGLGIILTILIGATAAWISLR
jgi:hypothetical protein